MTIPPLAAFIRNTLTGRYVPRDVTPFVVVYLPRTGSNYLASRLDSHPEILCHHEVFNPTGIHRSLSYKDSDLSFGTVEERDADPWAFIRRVYSFSDGAKAVGFKLGPGGPYNWPLLSLLLSRRVRKIVLERRKWLHAYTSVLIARETQVWSQVGPKKPTEQVRVSIEPRDLKRFVRRRKLFHRIVSSLAVATGQRFFFLDYDDIGDEETTRRLLAFLDVRPDVPLEAKTTKQNSRYLEERITNFAALRRQLAGTGLLQEAELGGGGD